MSSLFNGVPGEKLAICTGVALAIGVTTPVPALAQVALEEVVVTARKRAETLQETPVAVSVFDADALRDSQIESVGDLTRHVPGLSRREGRKEGDLSIRGIGTSTAGVRVDPGVGVYIDGVFIPRSDSQLVDVINVETAQVLRGPQGTLFGKNTAGGALLITAKKPGDEFEASIQGNIGNLNRSKFRGSVSGPVSDALSAGITVDLQTEDGHMEDAVTGREYGDTDRQSVTLQLRHDAGGIFSADMFLFWGEVSENSPPATCKLGDNAGALQRLTAPGATAAYRDICAASYALAEDDKVLNDALPLPWEMKNQMAGLTMAWDMGDYTFKSITGYLSQDGIIQSSDTDSSSLFVINNKIEVNRQLAANGFYPGDENRTFISQEFQFVGSAFDDRLRYTTGIFGSRETIDDSVTGVAIAPGGILGVPLSGDQVLTVPSQLAGLRNIDVSEYENTSWALFSQVILSLTEQWQLTLGGRYTRESKEALQLNYISASQPPGVVSREEYDALYNFEHELILNPEQPQSVGDASWNVFSPAATLTLFIPEDVKLKYVDSGMTYISVSEGFKAGGFSPFADRFLSFDPEEILSYELGLKMDLFEHRLRINSAIYYTDYQDIQLRVTRTFGDLNTLTGLTNAGEAAIRGAELELAVLATPNLLLGFNASYISPEYKEFFDEDSNGDAIDRSDDPFAYIPRRNFTLTAQYDREFSTGSAMASLSGFYQDSIFIGLDAGASADSAAYLPDYWLWNTRFSFKPLVVDGLDIAVYVNNLFDKDYFATGNFSVGGIGAASLIKGKPRTFGLDVKYSW